MFFEEFEKRDPNDVGIESKMTRQIGNEMLEEREARLALWMGYITKNLLVVSYHQHLTSYIDEMKLLYPALISLGKDRLVDS